MRGAAWMATACLGLGAGLGFGAGTARAEEGAHPRLTPERDVTVIYSVQPQGAPAPEQVSVAFAKDGNKLKIEPLSHVGATILDRPAQTVTLVLMKQHLYAVVTPHHGLRNPFLLDLSMHFTPQGTDRVAGLECGKWTIATPRGMATACVTPDGVILSEEGVDSDGLRGKLLAQTVTYAPIPAAEFQPPPGFEKVEGSHPPGGGLHTGLGKAASSGP